MKLGIALTLAVSLLAASPALAVSQADIDRLFANPPVADGHNMNTLLAAQTPPIPPQALLDMPTPPPVPVKNAALTTTNPPPALSKRPSTNPRDLENMFQVTYHQAEEAVSAALTERGVADKVGALMDGRKNAAIFAYSQPLRVQVRGLQMDQNRHRWNASILFATLDGKVVSALPAAGHYSEVLEVPVLKRAFRHGEIISEEDIELRDFALTRTRGDTISDLSSLIGKTPVRSVSPFRPIREAEVSNMPIVHRDSLVQISYSMPGMQITTTGQALAAGARGDVIEVRNTTSKKVVRAVIEASDRVEVIGPNVQTSQLTQ